ncbi:hypothetical protein VNO78_20717 [Psophocarpus tetragonolobus]|uniref:Uncharacterized protein n=1 Tax=Psophocarpus tetragonolobus TaxID=3891 RepID=A0AAN9SDW2_PSOTE
MGAGLKKDLRVSRVVPGGSLNAFLFLLIGVISQRLAMVKKKGEQAHLESAVQRIVLKISVDPGIPDIGQPFKLLLNPRAGKRQPSELKHLSSQRKRKQKRSSGECCTLYGESPVAESITSLCSDPSSMGHVESRVNQQGPPCKAKYSWVTDSEVVP